MSGEKSTARVLIEPLAIAAVLACAVRAAVALYSVPSASMAPSLQVGDHIVATPYYGSSPARGDIIVFRAPDRPTELRVKRVVALSGDLIDTTAGRVRVAGHALAEPYLMAQASSGSIAPQLVPANSLFVMGDNRADSLDSRNWGPLPRDLVVGRVRIVLWSSTPATVKPLARAETRSSASTVRKGLRLDRFFKCVE